MTNRSRETATMTTVECPWCEADASVTAATFECAACGIRESLAPEPETLAVAA